jgi:hypothetical protein
MMANPYEALRAEKDSLAERTKRALLDTLRMDARARFEADPDLESLSVRLYTDYFNDGEQCQYRVREDEEAEGLFDQFDGFDLEAVFGDHTQVTLTYDRATKTVTVTQTPYEDHD